MSEVTFAKLSQSVLDAMRRSIKSTSKFSKQMMRCYRSSSTRKGLTPCSSQLAPKWKPSVSVTKYLHLKRRQTVRGHCPHR